MASIRYFYPEVCVKLLVGGPLQQGLADELHRYWAVEVADLPAGDYGWGFVKLEPLFRPPGERFLVLDSDTALTGPVLALAHGCDADFIVDREEQPQERAKEIYYDWDVSAAQGKPLPEPAFLFNSGQWFGRSGVLRREDFDGLIRWGWPPRLADPSVFKNGDQGVLNLVLNRKVRAGEISVERVPLMCWPRHGMQGLNARNVAGRSAAARVVHWAGIKSARQRDVPGADVLEFFERQYYSRVRWGLAKRVIAGCRHTVTHVTQDFRVRAGLALRNRGMPRLAAAIYPASRRPLQK